MLQYEDFINGSDTATDTATGESAIVANEYHGIKVAFRKYIVDTPEEISEVLARKISANLMSIFAAVREQHPDWSDEAIYKEANLIYAEKSSGAIQVVDPSKPPEKNGAVLIESADAARDGESAAEYDESDADEEERRNRNRQGWRENNKEEENTQ